MDLQQRLTFWGYSHNVNMVTKWHNITTEAYCSFIDELKSDSSNPLSEQERKVLDSSMDEYMYPKVSAYSLIMHLSNFEEISYHVCQDANAELSNKSSIRRFQKGWKYHYGNSLDGMSSWKNLLRAEKIRNCVLHACERVSICKNKEEVEQIAKEEGLTIKFDKLRLCDSYLNKIKDSIFEMISGIGSASKSAQLK